MSIFSVQRAVKVGVLAAAVASSVAVAGPAGATPSGHYTNVSLTVQGGSAYALSNCMQFARAVARHHARAPQVQTCDNFTTSVAGDATLHNVGVAVVDDSRHNRHNVTNVTLNVEGGDAYAVSSCLQVAQNTASEAQRQTCTNTTVAQGGDASLRNVSVTVLN